MRPLSRAVALSVCIVAGRLIGLPSAEAQGGAYCYIRSVDVKALSNGIQIQVKADGILDFDGPQGSQGAGGGRVTETQIRFPGARLGLEKTLYDVDQTPVSTVSLTVPQDTPDGRGVVMTVSMTEPSRVEPTLSEDRQTFFLVVFGSRTVERTERGQAAGADVKTGTVEVTQRDGLISVRAVKADIHKVVLEIARQGGISVAVDDLVKHDVSVNVQDRKPLDVIRGIAAGYGLALSSVGDVYMLSEGIPEDLPTYRRSGTASFPMRYLKAHDAWALLPTFLFKYVHDNPEQNAVVVTAPSQMLDKIKGNLQAVDVPSPMIMVECAVAELTDSGDLDAGLRWHYESPEHEAGTDSGTGAVDYQEVDTGSALATAIAETTKLQIWLQGLITKGRAEVEAHPSMAAVNGKRAEIFIGSQRFIKVQYSQYGQTQERIETIPVGVRLAVTPWTGGNNEITSRISVEVSNIVALDPETGLPRLGSRKATTTMRTKDGDTIVIGGLSQRQEDKTYRRIPILGDLPIIGPLFRSESTRVSNTELVILIRPRLLDASGRLPAEDDAGIRGQFLRPGDLGYTEPPAQGR